MNQEKIGKFIAESRKQKKLTQADLAEKLGVTDRTISNWETGKNMPDLSLFKPLCDILGITINELMSGEKINDDEYDKKLEENFINTIDYIDKKNISDNYVRSIFWLVIGIVGICLSQFVFIDSEIVGYLNIVSIILIIYSIKQLVMKYRWVRKVIALLLIVLCVVSLLFS